MENNVTNHAGNFPKTLRIEGLLVDGQPIDIIDYKYSAARMGSATITATIMHPKCLDREWKGTEYVLLNGEKYYRMDTPSSSKSNTDARYKHDVTFYAEREILSTVYFYDAVSDDAATDDKYKSNSTKVTFFGDLREFVARLNHSLKYSGLDYTVVIDNDVIQTEAKLMSFEDKFFFDVLQEIYNVFEIPFYFVGKEIHIGYTDNAIPQVFKYGAKEQLLAVSKNNANYKIVTRCTGTGSSDNIPYYYPNNSEKGDIAAIAADTNTGITQSDISITDIGKYAREVDIDEEIEYSISELTGSDYVSIPHRNQEMLPNQPMQSIKWGDTEYNNTINVLTIMDIARKGAIQIGWTALVSDITGGAEVSVDCHLCKLYNNVTGLVVFEGRIPKNESLNININTPGQYYFESVLKCSFNPNLRGNSCTLHVKNTYRGDIPSWVKKSKVVDIATLGLKVTGEPEIGDKIVQKVIQKIPFSDKLLPSVYRETLGAERFYNAQNDTYDNPATGEKYIFENEYTPTNPREHTESFENIKPTITEMTNAEGQRIDEIIDVAFDLEDNDETDESGNYLHPYFFVKLRRFDGEHTFNLFEQSIEQGAMTISFTSGKCGACKFEIGVGEENQKNIVQVDDEGNLKRDEDGNVIRSGKPQESQNNTATNEVWLALRKEESTFGIIMPNAAGNIRPEVGDRFVILNINLPTAYITAAEERLKEAIIRYMWENNSEKFNFSTENSRIFLEENPEVASLLNENARLLIEYDSKQYTLYVSQFDCEVKSNEPLPKVSVELVETITVHKTTMQKAIDKVKQDILVNIGSIDFLKLALPYFIRKDVQDTARETINFIKGITFGNYQPNALGAGGAISLTPQGDSFAELDYLKVRKKAIFTQVSVEEIKHIGGQLILSPAAMICSNVEEYETYYRCYFNSDTETESIFNHFVIGDQAYHQTFNVKGNSYYWRLVTGIGGNYIDLSKEDADMGSGIPQIGDNIVQLGNRNDASRQSAHILSTVGINAPSYIVYNGINSFSLEGKQIWGNIFDRNTNEPNMFNYGSMFFGDKDIEDPEATFITFQQKVGESRKKMFIQANVALGTGSSGLTNLTEWPKIQEQIDKTEEAIDNINNDGIFSLVEKRSIREIMQQITPVKGIVNDSNASLYSKGTFHITYANASAKGFNTQASALLAQMTVLSTALTDDYKLWVNEDTAIETENFRDDIAQLFQDYYKVENELVSAITTSTLSYLEKIFPQSNLVSNGAILGQMLGVLDKDVTEPDAYIIAGMNGSAYDFNPQHGKILVFAGAPKTSAAPNLSGAKTIIYEDGTIRTYNLQAVEGQIGKFIIKNWSSGISGLESVDNTTDNEAEHTIELSSNHFEIIGKSKTSNQGVSVRIIPYRNSDKFDADGVLDIKSEVPTQIIPLINLSAQKNAPAISISQGYTEGIRQPMKRINTDYTLNKVEDHTIYYYSPTNRSIYLPASPENGQHFEIIKNFDADLTVRSTLIKIYNPTQGGTSTGYFTFARGTKAYLAITYSKEENLWLLTNLLA